MVMMLILLPACSLFEPEEARLTAPPDGYQLDEGSANFSRYVALGNSISAGYQSGALYESTQTQGWTALLARAMQVDEYALPRVADPGFFGTELEGPDAKGHLYLAFDEDGASLENVPWPAGITHYEQLLLEPDRPGPYHNLAIPGSVAYDLAHTLTADDCYTAILAGEENAYFDVVLRNRTIDWTTQGGATADMTAVEQAILLEPSFVTLWIGNNEILLPAARGEGLAFYSAEFLEIFYAGILDLLLAALPDVGIVVATVPEVTSVPFFTTLHWYAVDDEGEALLDPDTGEPIPLMAEERPLLAEGDLVLLEASDALDEGLGLDLDSAILRIMADTGLDSAQAAAAQPELLPRAGEPLSGELTLVAEEVATLAELTAGYNTVIDTLTAARGIPVMDAHAHLADAAVHGVTYDGVHLSTEFISGGLFSLDGVHPSSFGHAVIARHFIEAINEAYGANLRPPRLADLEILAPDAIP